MGPLDLVNLSSLMLRTRGRREIAIGLIDGPVNFSHPDLAGRNLREIPGSFSGNCTLADSAACMHGTFIAGMLSGRPGSVALAICCDCILLVRPIFSEARSANGEVPTATPSEVAAAIVDCVDAPAQVINLSLNLSSRSAPAERELHEALGYAAMRGVVTVAATGNSGMIGSSTITAHPGVIPVAACDTLGRPLAISDFSGSIGRRGLIAPGSAIKGLAGDGRIQTLTGTSVAASFVSGAIALLMSEFPMAGGAAIRAAVLGRTERRTIVPPLLNAWAAYQALGGSHIAS